MSFEPATLPELVLAARTVVADTITMIGVEPPAPGDPPPPGNPPAVVWTDMKPPPRTPQFLCDDGAVAAWVEAGRPTRGGNDRCSVTTDWAIRVRWWICFPSLDDLAQVPTANRQAVADRIHQAAQEVQRKLIQWACSTRYDGVNAIIVGPSTPVPPGGGSAGWEWLISVTM